MNRAWRTVVRAGNFRDHERSPGGTSKPMLTSSAHAAGQHAEIQPGNPMLPSAEIQCPYCGESIEVVIDDSAGDQRYIEDCHVCCRPISIAVTVEAQGTLAIRASAENDA